MRLAVEHFGFLLFLSAFGLTANFVWLALNAARLFSSRQEPFFGSYPLLNMGVGISTLVVGMTSSVVIFLAVEKGTRSD